MVKPRSATPTGISKIPTNSRVLVSRGPREPKIFGTAKYVGVTAFAPGTWVGVELDDELGKNNGTVQGHYYFTCSSNRGLFVKEENVELVRNTSSAVLPDYAPRYDMVGPPPAPQYSKEDQAILRNASTISELGMNGAVSRSFSNSQSPKHILNADSDDDERTRKDFGTIDSWDKHTIEQVDVNRTISNEPSNIHKSDAVALTPVEEKERRSKVRNLLKLKLSQLMNMLNEQLEIVELLESENEPSDQVSKAKNSVESIRQNILHITDQELELIQSFRTRLINKI